MPIAETLRAEIENAQKRRHDLVLRKFAFGGALLGLGSIRLPIPNGTTASLTPLIWIVPALLFAYDIYIVAEDYGIKRAGEFLRRRKKARSVAAWEEFVGSHDRTFAPLGFALVTFSFLIVAAFLLWAAAPERVQLWVFYLVVMAGAEAALLWYCLTLRTRLHARDRKATARSAPEAEAGSDGGELPGAAA